MVVSGYSPHDQQIHTYIPSALYKHPRVNIIFCKAAVNSMCVVDCITGSSADCLKSVCFFFFEVEMLHFIFILRSTEITKPESIITHRGAKKNAIL